MNNKGYNFWIFIISILTLAYAFLLEIRETFGSFKRLTFLDASMDYRVYIYAISAGLILLIGARRASKKWSGMRIANKLDEFKFTTPISMERRRLVVTNGAVEILFLLFLGILFLVFAENFYIIPIIFLILIIDSMVNMMMGVSRQKYRVGMTNKAIVEVDREVKALYFKGLKKITLHKDILYFEYVNDLVLDVYLDSIPEDRQEEFIELIRDTVDEKTVYFSGFGTPL